jgi:SAM-dependent MidA family methyltransferase
VTDGTDVSDVPDVPDVPGPWRGWREATEEALYGRPEDGEPGFFVRERPEGHFRTSVHASPLFASAVAELLRRVDEALGRPRELAFVDVGAGGGELIAGVHAAVPSGLRARLRLYAVERADRPEGLDASIRWLTGLPEPGSVTGLVFANEWLDNVPVDVAGTDDAGEPRMVLVAPDGTERLGSPVTGPDADWLARWWPLGGDRTDGSGPGSADGSRSSHGGNGGEGTAGRPAGGGEPDLRAEIGHPRDAAWARAVRCLAQGLAVAVDYGHERAARPPFGTLTGFRDGREVRPVPDGSCDITSHVALDACAAAGSAGGRRGTGTSPGTGGAAVSPGAPGVAAARASGPAATGTTAATATGHQSTGNPSRAIPPRAAPRGSAPQAGSPAGSLAESHAESHAAVDSVAAGAPSADASDPVLLSQREALHALGVRGGRPPLALASADPVAYVRALSSAGEAAELTDLSGLGGFTWLVQPVGPAAEVLAAAALRTAAGLSADSRRPGTTG